MGVWRYPSLLPCFHSWHVETFSHRCDVLEGFPISVQRDGVQFGGGDHPLTARVQEFKHLDGVVCSDGKEIYREGVMVREVDREGVMVREIDVWVVRKINKTNMYY